VSLRLAHLSDIHFGGENVAATAAALDWLNAEPLDLVVVSGDLTCFGEPGEFEAAAAWLAAVARPKLVTPGNHDAPYFALAQRLFTPFGRFQASIGPAGIQSHRGEGLAVRGLNTARGPQPRLNWSKGQLAPAQVADALAWFSGAPAEAARVVVCHHPLTEMIGGPMTARVWGGEAGAQALAEGGVDLVLSGHIHAPFVWPYAFGDGRTYAVGAGTLSVRERGVPASFNLVEIDRAEIHVTALTWSGSRFAPYRTWSVDRR
jgi:3',5'-cyclic AMP phosphodiesterase CpdA